MADTLFNMLGGDPDVDYCAYFGSFSNADKTVWVTKRTGKQKQSKKKKKKTGASKTKPGKSTTAGC